MKLKCLKYEDIKGSDSTCRIVRIMEKLAVRIGVWNKKSREEKRTQNNGNDSVRDRDDGLQEPVKSFP